MILYRNSHEQVQVESKALAEQYMTLVSSNCVFFINLPHSE